MRKSIIVKLALMFTVIFFLFNQIRLAWVLVGIGISSLFLIPFYNMVVQRPLSTTLPFASTAWFFYLNKISELTWLFAGITISFLISSLVLIEKESK